MKIASATDNSLGITFGGATLTYELRSCDIACISSGDRGTELAVVRRVATSKEWKFPSECQVENSIVEACGGSQVLARLLVRRGLRTPEEVAQYLDPSLYTPSAPVEFADMSKAVGRIMQAIANHEKITIYGDYDVDGVTATAVMVTTLRDMGAEVDYYIPTRTEGYGLNLKAVSVLASKHRTKLLISCDCGISNFSEVNFAKSLGVETIIVDHHTMPELLPPAVAILHPKQLPEQHPLYHLPGVGVAFKLAEALLIETERAESVEGLLDLVTLGMIADMVPLVKECRYLVQVGMDQLVNSKRAGIKALLQQVGGRDGGTDLVGFGLAPRINAVGRLSDANTAVKLMITSDEAEASDLARQLEYENVRRQELCEEIFAKADQAAQANVQAGDKAIAVYSEGWHHGVVGIVASRLVEKYHCPVFIGELDVADGIIKGSARGVESIDLYEVLRANEQLAMKWGGHKMAAGFSVEVGKADLFCRAIVDTCNRMLADKPLVPVLDIDLEVKPADVTMDLAKTIVRMAPFGIGNRKPVLAMRAAKAAGSRMLGKEGKHSRIGIRSADGMQFECVYWNSYDRVPADGQTIDVAFMPDINTYNGTTRLQLILSDWRDPAKPMVSNMVPAPAALSNPADNSRLSAGAAVQPEANFAPPGAKDSSSLVRPLPSARTAPQHNAPGDVLDMAPPTLVVKDLRTRDNPAEVLQAAVRKLGSSINLFGEACPAVGGVQLLDRTTLQPVPHLLIWQYPPALQVFKSIVHKTNCAQLYLVGGVQAPSEDASAFLKRLLGVVRFAVNQKEGQAEPERMAAALSATKMSIALGLTVLKKINVIDWFAEDGCVYLDLIGQPSGKPEQLGEFRQLVNCLKEIAEFRAWCDKADPSEIQLAIGPAVAVSRQPAGQAQPPSGGGNLAEDNSGIYQHEQSSELPSTLT